MNLINWLGVGIVAATKETNTKEILVHLPSMAPMADGRVIAQTQQMQETSLNMAGEAETSTTLTSNVIPAVWNSFGDANRLTAPDVREGSKVSIYQVGGQNQYYWTTQGFGADSHRLETIVWGFQANPAVDENTPFNLDNFYTITLDTRNGFMAMRTAQSNNEKSGFEAKIDGMNGRVDLRGSNGNIFSFDDHQHRCFFTNEEGAIWSVSKKKIQLIAPDSFTVSAEESINLITKQLNVKVEGEIAIQAERARVRIPTTEWEGDIELKGNVDQQGNFDQVGNTFTTGMIQGMSGVKTAITDLDTHTTTGVRGGNDISGTPVPVPQPPIGGF